MEIFKVLPGHYMVYPVPNRVPEAKKYVYVSYLELNTVCQI